MARHSNRVKQILEPIYGDSFAMIPLQRPLSFEHYQKWLAQKHQGSMDYMAVSAEVREHPQQHFAPMRSMIVFTQPYFPMDNNEDNHFPSLKIAHYARNKDYHIWFRQQLQSLIDQLKQDFAKDDFLAFTDAVPLLERDHAAQASLGWIGKNTCLIHPKKGSLFFIGEILTTLECEETFTPMHDFCGHCTACMDQCPTQAIISPRVLDANRCLAHWNIESREVPPIEIREKMQGWLFGCDICQTVCPWNIKLFKQESQFSQKSGTPDDMIKDLKFILNQSNKKLMKVVQDSPLSRAGGRGLKRNALIVIANLKLTELTESVQAYTDHELLGELAQWTLNQLKA